MILATKWLEAGKLVIACLKQERGASHYKYR
ncbi:hypothetical protein EV128_109109 [Rhizobium azibense]|nr:hypothetical protein EV128_109109 [Rhizobium azibense]